MPQTVQPHCPSGLCLPTQVRRDAKVGWEGRIHDLPDQAGTMEIVEAGSCPDVTGLHLYLLGLLLFLSSSFTSLPPSIPSHIFHPTFIHPQRPENSSAPTHLYIPSTPSLDFANHAVHHAAGPWYRTGPAGLIHLGVGPDLHQLQSSVAE